MIIGVAEDYQAVCHRRRPGWRFTLRRRMYVDHMKREETHDWNVHMEPSSRLRPALGSKSASESKYECAKPTEDTKLTIPQDEFRIKCKATCTVQFYRALHCTLDLLHDRNHQVEMLLASAMLHIIDI